MECKQEDWEKLDFGKLSPGVCYKCEKKEQYIYFKQDEKTDSIMRYLCKSCLDELCPEWGEPGDWREYTDSTESTPCDSCGFEIPINGKTWCKREANTPGVFSSMICPACYSKHVLKEPLADTIEKEKAQMARANWEQETQGDETVIRSFAHRDPDPKFYIHTPAEIHWTELTEVTHSCELEFPNGDRVSIPPP